MWIDEKTFILQMKYLTRPSSIFEMKTLDFLLKRLSLHYLLGSNWSCEFQDICIETTEKALHRPDEAGRTRDE